MKKWLVAFLLLLAAAPMGRAQLSSFGEVPIEINADSTQFLSGVAVAEGHVVIQYGSITIYSDYSQYNPDTRDVLVRGNVRIFRNAEPVAAAPAASSGPNTSHAHAGSHPHPASGVGGTGGQIFIGERAVYNLETKQLRAADFGGDSHPFRFSADTLSSLGTDAFVAQDALFTTSDSSKPDYYIKAKTARIYPKDRIIFSNAALYVGKTPIFWWPYLYQSLKRDTSFTITPGYLSAWGAFALAQYTFPIAPDWTGRFRLDLRSNRGVAVGFESSYKISGDDRNWGRFRVYYARDDAPGTNETALGREPIDADRYRVSFQQKLYITDDVYASIDIDKLSDARVLQDFLRNEYRLDPQPDNVISLTKWDNNYTATLIGRKQLNNFFDATERLPEFVFDFKRQQLGDSPIFYQGETGVANIRRNFAQASGQPDYRSLRLDSFHEVLYPTVLGGWLSLTPRFGVRGTYYSQSGHTETDVVETTIDTILPDNSTLKTASTITQNNLVQEGAVFRGVVEGGFESSFKFSREWNNVESRAWGLDGLRHVVQPYTDLSLVYSSQSPDSILQLDRFQRSSQLPIFDFPQFTSVDAINNWAIWRVGVRNRLQTKRDNATFNWFQLDTFVDVNILRPRFPGSNIDEGLISNLYNRLHWTPLPWVSLAVDSQVPTNPKGFTEVDSSVNLLVNSNLRVGLGHRYINDNPSFINSSLISFNGYYRVDDNWGFSAREDYEAAGHTLQTQTYQLHRDLSSWVAALGFVVNNNGSGSINYGVLLTFTLKDLPSVSAPLNFDPAGLIDSTSGL